MDGSEIHYLTYDADEMMVAMMTAYMDAGGDVIRAGDEKEILLRGVQSIIMQAFAGIDNALRMDTLRYAVGDYLDLYGEKRKCYRIQAERARATVTITTADTGVPVTIPAGSPLTEDGSVIYLTEEEILLDGETGTVTVMIVAEQAGSRGNSLEIGANMTFLTNWNGATAVTCVNAAAGGRDREEDEEYRERIRLYGLTTITTGPSSQYESIAMSVTSEIVDARAINEGDGMVGVYLLLSDESGSAAIIAAVEDALNPEDARPLTDTVSVALSTKKDYVLKVKYSTSPGANVGTALTEAVSRYQDWQDKKIGQAFNPDMLVSYLYQAGCVRVVFDTGSNFDGGTVEYTEIGADEHCAGTITLEVMST